MTDGVALLPLLDARNVCYAAAQSFAVRNVCQRHRVLKFEGIVDRVHSNNCDIMYYNKHVIIEKTPLFQATRPLIDTSQKYAKADDMQYNQSVFLAL